MVNLFGVVINLYLSAWGFRGHHTQELGIFQFKLIYIYIWEVKNLNPVLLKI